MRVKTHLFFFLLSLLSLSLYLVAQVEHISVFNLQSTLSSIILFADVQFSSKTKNKLESNSAQLNYVVN